MLVFYGAAIALGATAGVAFTSLWLWLVPHHAHRRFWSEMALLSGELLRADDARALIRQYRRLAVLLGAYLGRNIAGTVLACLPVIAILLTAAPLVFDAWDARAARLTLVPQRAAPFVPSGATLLARTAYCSTEGYCALFEALDFNIVKLKRHDIAYAVVRADHSDRNPLWPFLSDIEAAFFAAFVATTFAGLLWPRRS